MQMLSDSEGGGGGRAYWEFFWEIRKLAFETFDIPTYCTWFTNSLVSDVFIEIKLFCKYSNSMQYFEFMYIFIVMYLIYIHLFS